MTARTRLLLSRMRRHYLRNLPEKLWLKSVEGVFLSDWDSRNRAQSKEMLSCFLDHCT